jgi:hypothetical protein
MPTTTSASAPSRPAANGGRRKVQVVLYDVHEVARFLHAVAYARVVASNTSILRGNFTSGGDQVDIGNSKKIQNDADRLAGTLMTDFSQRCKTGSKSSVHNFLELQQRLYQDARQQIDRVYAQVRKSNADLQRNLDIGADILHMIHGTANATFTVLSFFAGPGGGAVAAKALNTADGLISQTTVIGVVKQGAEVAVDEAAEKVGEKYSDKAAKTLVNIVTRDWKYQGALQNAQVRLAKQGGVAVGAKTLGFYFAVKSLNENMKEIREAFENLRQTEPANQAQVKSVPELELPALR